MLPTGREFIWLLVGVVLAMFVIPWARSAISSRGQGSSGG